MRKNKYKTEHDYINYEDLLLKLGYKQYKPRLGTLGRALLEASKGQRSDNFLKRYWDSYFRKLRQEKRRKDNGSKKQNSRLDLQSDVTNHT